MTFHETNSANKWLESLPKVLLIVTNSGHYRSPQSRPAWYHTNILNYSPEQTSTNQSMSTPGSSSRQPGWESNPRPTPNSFRTDSEPLMPWHDLSFLVAAFRCYEKFLSLNVLELSLPSVKRAKISTGNCSIKQLRFRNGLLFCSSQLNWSSLLWLFEFMRNVTFMKSWFLLGIAWPECMTLATSLPLCCPRGSR